MSALSRFTVIDLTRVRSGPTCARQFADWGATVITVEPAGEFEDFTDRNDPDFQNLHRNKKSLTLNLKSPEGAEVFRRLAARADVVLENYRPDVKFRLGIDYETLRQLNPRLVYVSISGFGEDGPYRDLPGLDQIAQGMGGLMSITGAPGQGPMRAGIAVADMSAGLLAAVGALTALLEREVSGEGQWVRTSLLEAQIFMLDFQAARWLINGKSAGQVGNDHPTVTPMGCFRTRDGYLNIAPISSGWPKFCALLGLDDLARDPQFATNAKRVANRARVNEIVQGVIAGKDNAAWMSLFGAAGIACGPVNSIAQVFADPQVRHLGIAQPVQSKALGQIDLVGQAITMSRSISPLTSAAPDCGEDSDEILRDLDYSSAQIAALRRDGVI